jgi:hypothetical protein
MISLSLKKAIEAKGHELEAKRHEFMGEMNGRVSHMMHIKEELQVSFRSVLFNRYR